IPLIGSVPALVGAIASGAFGAIRDGFGAVTGLIGHAFGADRGELHADEGGVGGEGRFVIVALSEGSVAVLTHTGYMCADRDRSNEAWADREAIGPWERWRLINNQDGTFSFQSDLGHYLCTDYNLDDRLPILRERMTSVRRG